jgi:hypothetical protein
MAYPGSAFPPPNTPAAASPESWPALGFLVIILRTKVSKASFTREFSFAYSIDNKKKKKKSEKHK